MVVVLVLFNIKGVKGVKQIETVMVSSSNRAPVNSFHAITFEA